MTGKLLQYVIDFLLTFQFKYQGDVVMDQHIYFNKLSNEIIQYLDVPRNDENIKQLSGILKNFEEKNIFLENTGIP